MGSDSESTDLSTRVRGQWSRALKFLDRDLWLKLPEARGPRWGYRLLRMGVLIVEGFVKSDVFTLAAALTYQVTFAMVPLLVVMLAVFKGFGGMTRVGGQVQEFLLRNLTPEAGGDVVARMNEFIEKVNATAIGVVGFAALLYTSLSLLTTIEKTFNRIWGIKSPRTLLRRFTVYWTFLTVSPILLAASLSMTTFVTSNGLYTWLTAHVPLLGSVTLRLAPFVMAWIMFAGFYIFMPNTRVRPLAAIMGGVVSGTIWEAMKTGYVWYNSHFLSTQKFYGALGAIPIFLLWVYLSWIVVLFGAEVAFAVQHVNTYRREIELLRLSESDRDRLALVVTVAIVRAFTKGDPAPTGEEAAEKLNATVRAVNEVLFELATQGILREITLPGRKEPGFVPARDPGVMTARDVLAAVRTYGDHCTLPEGPSHEATYRLVNEAEELATSSLSRVTLRQLAAENPADPLASGPPLTGPAPRPAEQG
jgi:membrane protein